MVLLYLKQPFFLPEYTSYSIKFMSFINVIFGVLLLCKLEVGLGITQYPKQLLYHSCEAIENKPFIFAIESEVIECKNSVKLF